MITGSGGHGNDRLTTTETVALGVRGQRSPNSPGLASGHSLSVSSSSESEEMGAGDGGGSNRAGGGAGGVAGAAEETGGKKTRGIR